MSVPLLVGSVCVMLLALHCAHQPGSATELQWPEFLLGLCYVVRTDFIIGHVVQLSLPRGQPGPKFQPSNQKVDLSGNQAHPEGI